MGEHVGIRQEWRCAKHASAEGHFRRIVIDTPTWVCDQDGCREKAVEVKFYRDDAHPEAA